MTDATAKPEAAPAAIAAIFFIGGILLGAPSVTGSGRAIALAGCCAFSWPSRHAARSVVPPFSSRLRSSGRAWDSSRPASASGSRRKRPVRPSAGCRRKGIDRIESKECSRTSGAGRLRVFAGGCAPSASGPTACGAPSRPRCSSFCPARPYPEAKADRGDRVIAAGHLSPEDVPPSERDLSLPWPAYRLSIKSAALLERRGPTALSYLTLPNRWLHARLPRAGAADPAFDRDVRGPLSALLLGRTADLERGMVARYRRGGLYHLLVVAGLHVALAGGLVMLALRSLRVRGKPRDAAFLAVVLVFVLVGGGNAPAVRAGTVFGLHRASRLLERPIPNLQALGLSALILFGAEPAQVYSIGSVLTFAAVCGIALFTGPVRARLPGKPGELFSGLSAALAAQAATAPILLWRFNLVSAGAWLTAPLAIPMLGGMIALGAALLIFFAVGVTPWPLVHLFALGSRSLEFVAERAAGTAYLRPTPPLAAVLAVSGATPRREIRASPREVGRARLCRGALSLPGGAVGARRGRSAASRSRRSTSARATRCSCAGTATRSSWTAGAPSISTSAISGGPASCPSFSIAASPAWTRSS